MGENTCGQDEMERRVQGSLENTPHACSSLAKLSGGVANYVYRGNLRTILPDGSETVVVKHTEAFSASNNNFKISDTRCDYEQTMLQALAEFPVLEYEGVEVATPHLYHFFPETNTQIYRDLPASLDLKSFVLTRNTLTETECRELGHALGRWLGTFHEWGTANAQRRLVEKMGGNKEMVRLKFMINYEMLVGTIPNFEAILGGERERHVFGELRKRAKAEMESGEGQLIHGDMWSGNVILSNSTLQPVEQTDERSLMRNTTKVLILDWELAQISSPAYDLGQMLAELFCLYHFRALPAGLWLMEAFVRGYRDRPSSEVDGTIDVEIASAVKVSGIDRELAFKTAIHAGVHLICWGSRVGGWGTREQVEGVVNVGREWVVEGYEGNLGAFLGGPLGVLFE